MYRHFGKALIRTPLFSYHDLLPSGEEPFDFAGLLDKKLHDPVFLEALYWASPEIYLLAAELKNGHIKEGKKKEKLLHTLKKYIIRAGSRSTPYGLFAGCGTVNVAHPKRGAGKQSESTFFRKIRIDTALLNSIIEHIKTNPELWYALNYRTNSSLYVIHGTYRYMEYRLKQGERDYQLNAVAQSPELDLIISRTKLKPLNVESLAELISEDCSQQEKLHFLQELIDMQFLVTELELEVTGNNQLQRLKDQLSMFTDSCPAVTPYLELLAHVETVCKQFEESAPGLIPLTEINALRKHLDELGISFYKQTLFHADLGKKNSNDAEISQATVEMLLKAIRVLSMFSPKRSANEELLRDFKHAFTEKYDTQEIPLSEVTDMEAGIGFPVPENIGNIAYNPVTEKLKMPHKPEAVRRRYRWHSFLQEKVLQAEAENKKAIVLTDHELQPFDKKTGQLANTLSLLFSALPDGQLILHSAGGATANSLIARFAYLNDDIAGLVKQVSLKDEELIGASVLAEIAHLPEGRVGNVIRRPVTGNYEIPFLAETRTENQMHIDDLMVSVRDNQIILRSQKLDKRVIPRLSCAHNYSTSQLSVYHFLSALQFQGQVTLEMNLGMWAADRKFMPRISYGKVILRLATWYFRPADYRYVLEASLPLRALAGFLRHWELPRFIAITDGDNELLFDTSDEAYLSLLLEELGKNKPVKCIEWLYFDTQRPVPADAMVNQYILPLYHESPVASIQVSTGFSKSGISVPRTFAPGSEWIYLKIYCSAYLSDELLSGPLAELSSFLLENGLTDQLFFIRYTDPHYHIRYRMHLTDSRHATWGAVMQKINSSLEDAVSTRAIWKIQIDTYSREIERYGNDHMLLTEQLFSMDSLVYLNLIKEELFVMDENLRLLTALKNIDKWLILFKLDPEERIIFCTQMSEALLKEFGNERKSKIDLQYREMKKEIAGFMESTMFDELFELRNEPCFYSLPRENLSSYIHMSMNRWFRSDQRLMEFICYTFCAKHYQMQTYCQAAL